MSAISQNTLAESPVGVEPNPLDFPILHELRIGVEDEIIFRPALRELFNEFPYLEISAPEGVEQTHVYNDTVQFLETVVTATYEFENVPSVFLDASPGIPFGPLTVNSIGEAQYEGLMNFEPGEARLEITVQDEVIRSYIVDDSATFLAFVVSDDVYRPVLILVLDEYANLEFGDQSTHTYFYPHTAGDPLRTPGIPFGPLTLNAIAEEQYEGLMNFFPTEPRLVVDADVDVQQTHVYNDEAQFLQFGFVEDFFRPILRENIDSYPALNIGATDKTYPFYSWGYGYLEQSPGIPLQTISENPTATEQYVYGTFALTYTIDDNATLIINAVSLVDRNNQVVEVDDTIELTVVASHVEQRIFEVDDSLALELKFGIEDYDSINISRLYSVPAAVEIAVQDAIVRASIVVDTTALELTATSTTVDIYKFTETPALTLEGTFVFTQQFVYDDTAQFLETVVTSVDYAFNTADSSYLEVTASEVTSSSRSSVLPYAQLQVEAEHVEERLFVYNDLVPFLQTAATSVEYQANLDDTVSLVLSDTSTQLIRHLVVESAAIETTVTQTTTTALGPTDAAALEITAATTTGQIYEYDDNAEFLQASATDIVVISKNDNTVHLNVAATDVVKQIFSFTETAQFLETVVTSLEYLSNINDAGYLVTVADQEIKVRSVFDTTASTIIASTLVTSSTRRSIDSAALRLAETGTTNIVYNIVDSAQFLETVVTSNEITSATDNNGHLNVAAATDVKQRFVFNDTAVFFQAAATSIVYQTEVIGNVPLQVAADTTVKNIYKFDETASLTTTSYATVTKSMNSVSTLPLIATVTQSIGVGVKNTAGLEVTASDEHKFRYVFTEAANAVISTAQSFKNIFNSVETSAINVGNADTTSTLRLYPLATIGLTLGTDVSNISIFNYVDTTNLGSVVIEDTDLISNVETIPFLQFGVTDDVVFAQVYDDTAELTVSDTATELTIYNVVDTTNLGSVVIEDTDYIAVYETIPFVQFAATDVIEVAFAFTDTVELATSVTASDIEIYNFVDATNLGSVVIDDTDYIAVYETIPFVQFGATSDIDVIYNFVETPSLETEVTASDIEIYNFVDATNLGSVVIDDTDYIAVYETIPFVQFGATDQVNFAQVFADTTNVELAASAVDTVSYNFVDSGEIGTVVIQDVDYIAVVESIPFVQITATDNVNQLFNFVQTSDLAVSDTNTQSIKYVFSDTAQFLETVVTSTEILVNVENEAVYQIGVTAQSSVTHVFDDTTGFIIEGEAVLVRSLQQISSGGFEWTGYSFAQGYTLFKQIYANDVIALRLEVDSDEMKITGAAAQQTSRQIWIG